MYDQQAMENWKAGGKKGPMPKASSQKKHRDPASLPDISEIGPGIVS